MRHIPIMVLFLATPFLSLAQSDDALATDSKLKAAVAVVSDAADKVSGHKASYDYPITGYASMAGDQMVFRDHTTTPIRLIATLKMSGEVTDWSLTENTSLFGGVTLTMKLTFPASGIYETMFNVRKEYLSLWTLKTPAVGNVPLNESVDYYRRLFEHVGQLQSNSLKQAYQSSPLVSDLGLMERFAMEKTPDDFAATQPKPTDMDVVMGKSQQKLPEAYLKAVDTKYPDFSSFQSFVLESFANADRRAAWEKMKAFDTWNKLDVRRELIAKLRRGLDQQIETFLNNNLVDEAFLKQEESAIGTLSSLDPMLSDINEDLGDYMKAFADYEKAMALSKKTGMSIVYQFHPVNQYSIPKNKIYVLRRQQLVKFVGAKEALVTDFGGDIRTTKALNFDTDGVDTNYFRVVYVRYLGTETYENALGTLDVPSYKVLLVTDN